MDLVYAAADLAIARAGALTIAELTACGIPAILIPYPYAAADHQTHNAAEVVAAGAAEMVADNELDNIKLMNRAADIIRSGRLQTMQTAARQLGRPQAANDIAREVLRLAENKGEDSDADSQSRTG
jgi:UDP-N-acetylglucosamine--N-acetylmuramyl-(pentapeptide) pyrophosphoryl-undecaprenol N-acetylglucosamine transferase